MKKIFKYLDPGHQAKYWDQNGRSFDHPIVTFFAKQRLKYVKKYIDLSKISSAFDVGCGDGFATHYFAKYIKNIKGGDISEAMLAHNPIPRKNLQVIDAENMPIKSETYDLVYTWEVLHHVPDPAKAVSEMARISKDYVLIFEPNRNHIMQFIFGLIVKEERGTIRSSRKYLKKICEEAGLEIVKAEHVGKFPPNKTPFWLFKIAKKLPFKSTILTGISVVIVARKKTHASN